MSVSRFRRGVLQWYRGHGRDLPWRRTTNPYRIIVSEVMLQQTQVERVVPLYNAFLRRFPDPQSLARAPLGEVLRAWRGLGYNRRAKLLWLLAQELVKLPYGNNNKILYGKIKQMSPDELRALPGIGHYTAAAVLVFSANRDSVAIDTNVRRVHQRYFGDASEERVRASVPAGKAREWHNALMDFGSLICVRTPRCAQCPLRRTCHAYATQTFTVSAPKQSAFLGSNRYHRGRILDALRERSRTRAQLHALGEREKIDAALAELLREAMVRKRGAKYAL